MSHFHIPPSADTTLVAVLRESIARIHTWDANPDSLILICTTKSGETVFYLKAASKLSLTSVLIGRICSNRWIPNSMAGYLSLLEVGTPSTSVGPQPPISPSQPLLHLVQSPHITVKMLARMKPAKTTKVCPFFKNYLVSLAHCIIYPAQQKHCSPSERFTFKAVPCEPCEGAACRVTSNNRNSRHFS